MKVEGKENKSKEERVSICGSRKEKKRVRKEEESEERRMERRGGRER